MSSSALLSDFGNIPYKHMAIVNLHFRVYREDYYIQKVKMALSNPVYHIRSTPYIFPRHVFHMMSHISHIFCCAGC
jgi:hypothetical protein